MDARQQSRFAEFAAAMSYTGGPARVGVGLRVGRDGDVPAPCPPYPRLYRGLDTALCCGHKMAPRADVLRFAPLGASVLFAH